MQKIPYLHTIPGVCQGSCLFKFEGPFSKFYVYSVERGLGAKICL